jgi:hypothetical protein
MKAKRKKTFRGWLWDYLDSDCPIGDLARDAKRDTAWTGRSAESLENSMYEKQACSAALRTLKEAKERYESSFTIDELIAEITPENRHGEIDFGPPVGKEFGASDDD